MSSASARSVTDVLASPGSATHVVLFQHPNSRLPQTWGTAEVDSASENNDVDVDQVIMEAWLTDPHHSLENDYFDIEQMREVSTVFPVDDPVHTPSAHQLKSKGGEDDD